jgi:predicted signal transduction protein with EAL and GGDEF domain
MLPRILCGTCSANLFTAGAQAADTITVPGGSITVKLTREDSALDLSALHTWVRNSAQSVTTFYGRFPIEQTQLVVTLDDFGTGLSSFGCLKHFPVDFLKIDGSFVKGVLHDPIDREMVRSINEIGHLTGKQTIAEWAENAEIIEVLRGLGVDNAQGYGVSQPQRVQRAAIAYGLTPFSALRKRRTVPSSWPQ